MKHLITITKGGLKVDQFSPKENPLSCFRDQINEHLKTLPDDEVRFQAFGQGFSFQVNSWEKLIHFLNLDGKQVDLIKAIPSYSVYNNHVVLQAIED